MIEADKTRSVGVTSVTADGRFDRMRFWSAKRVEAKRRLATRWARAEEREGFTGFMRRRRLAGRGPGAAACPRARA